MRVKLYAPKGDCLELEIPKWLWNNERFLDTAHIIKQQKGVKNKNGN